jgi:putative Mn2+ efflux pump MntP
MGWFSLFAVALALAMDAFAVAIVAGLTLSPMTKRHVFRLSFHFGLFQALMPLIGWTAGSAVYRYIADFDHWVAFGLLSFVGGRMILSYSRGDEEKRTTRDPTSGWDLVILSVATSIDALAVGISFAFLSANIAVAVLTIGLVCFFITGVGFLAGRKAGQLLGERAEAVGGIILIGIGLRILLEHLL